MSQYRYILLISCITISCCGLVTCDNGVIQTLVNLQPINSTVHAVKEFWALVGPGGKLHPAYFLEHKGHLVIEGILLSVILYLFLQNSFKPGHKSEPPLTEKEIEALCNEWQPEPLVPKLSEAQKLPKPKVMSRNEGLRAIVENKKVLNMANCNFLNLSSTPGMTEAAKAAIVKYGVGSCGPRGFYGTIDVHLDLEKSLATFMGTDEAIIYSYDIATVTSIIPAFANRKDVLVVDECCSYPIQQGATLSRAAVHFFKHNDMQDLERVLQMVDKQHQESKKPLNRRFIIVEGIYTNNGDIAPLDKIYAIKEKYKYRVIVEESMSFGVLGKTGRGACEHFGLKPGQMEIVCASMGNTLGSVGGFCVGPAEIVEHQRLSGSGYCFSASLPPYLASAADWALHTLSEQSGKLLTQLQRSAAALRKELRKVPGLALVGAASSDDISPVVHLRLAKSCGSALADEQLLQKVVDHVFDHSAVLLSVARYSNIDKLKPPPSIKLFACAQLREADINLVATALKKAVKELL